MKTVLLCIQIHMSLSKSMPVALVLLDMLAAFDAIDHDTLLTCLSASFGFTGTLLRWLRTYLLDHFQSVKIGSVISDCFKLNFGVHQDSVLSPLLFTTSFSRAIEKCTVKYHSYADDLN